ncbi:MAG: FAD-dependent oxidoreductase [Sedimentibacter sp.]|uniref:FAD-dependent oxidoreductase n=1 Tax=Sedimentibacter sp. TaxID=1960295 RepID=UPI003159778D
MKRFKKFLTMSMLSALLLAAALLLPGCTKSAEEATAGSKDAITKNEQPSVADKSETIDTEVVVVGSGAAGLSASIEARQQGLNVILLEKNGFTGGTTNSAEGYGGLNSNYGESQGINYDIREVFFAAQNFHHWTTDQDIIMKLYENSGEGANWLESLGVEFEGIVPNGNNKFDTWHLYKGTGTQFVKTMTDKAKELGVEILLETRGKELVMKDGKVAGIKAIKKDGSTLVINAPVVILATGGYAGNPEMIEEYAKVDADAIYDTGVAGRTGDGIKMALTAGASDKRLKGSLMNFGASMRVYGVYEPINILGWLPVLKVNQEGNRFVDESMIIKDWGTNGNAQRQQGIVYHIITKKNFDNFIENGFPGYWPEIPNLYDEIDEALKEHPDYVFVADSIDELAQKINIDKTQLHSTIDKYNSYGETGVDLDYGKDAEFLYPVEEGPYYAFKFEVGIFATTDGLEVTPNAQVLDKDGNIIPGLYAGGSDAGGLNGETYEVSVVPGAQQAFAVNFGRFAAQDAARYLNK